MCCLQNDTVPSACGHFKGGAVTCGAALRGWLSKISAYLIPATDGYSLLQADPISLMLLPAEAAYLAVYGCMSAPVFVVQVRQLFERFSCTSAASVPDARFEFFKSQVWPRLAEGAAGGLLLVVPNYFDFVRVR